MRRRRRDEAGYAALLVALLTGTVFLGLAAIAVDVARWYVEVERVQKAADAAALAGVTYLPADMANARATALRVAAQNGFVPGPSTTISISQGGQSSQLKVAISSSVDNSFGAALGVASSTISRSAVADFTAPAPMGSPCNTFGNEPPSQPGAALPIGTALPTTPFSNCSSAPQFWAAIEGPATDKVQGDRYMTTSCSSRSVYACDPPKNEESRAEGYFFAVHVEPAAVGTPIEVQVYDPAYVYTSVNCSSIRNLADNASDNLNEYTSTDGRARYDDTASRYCSGDYNPGGSSGETPFTTSFVLREQTDTHDPMRAAPIAGCTKQFRGRSTAPTFSELRMLSSSGEVRDDYNRGLAKVFHQWVSLCSFTPVRSGDYYLQVRTNVSLGGTPEPNANTRRTFDAITYSGNNAAAAPSANTATGEGLNSFALRAVPTSSTELRSQVSVAGWSRMPILQNASASTARFNLIRALPATKGQYVAFDFFDAADGSTSNGSVRVIPPVDATGSIKGGTGIAGCRGAINDGTFSNLTNCTVTVRSSTHNGRVQRMMIPLPDDYNCDARTLGGCWFTVEIKFSGNVTDFTTWDANISGDPVRLVE